MSEPLHGFAIRDSKLIIAVTSNGCTNASSFRLDAVSGIAGFMLTIERITPDHCRMVPHIREFEFDLPEQLNGQSFTVQNKFVAGPRWLGVAPADVPSE